ncbi:MAG: DUF2867 domain-containing protein, partial [Planctomycetota bacterium]
QSVQEVMPRKALTVREAIRYALAATESGRVETRWSVAGPIEGDPDWAGGKVFVDERSIDVNADADSVFEAVCRVGGGHGWYAGDLLWQIRGWMDQAVGGPGLRRGRRHPQRIEYGETLDFWRVVGLERGRSLALRAEMKLPGDAQLEFNIRPPAAAATASDPALPSGAERFSSSEIKTTSSHGTEPEVATAATQTVTAKQPAASTRPAISTQPAMPTRLTMRARYRPKGLIGIAYWYAVVPLHNLVFGGMLKGIRDTAEAIRRGGEQVEETAEQTTGRRSGYGRSRLWLGISAVGSIVVASSLALGFDAPGLVDHVAGDSLLGTLGGLLLFVLAYVAVHLPFDFLGGYLLPRRH